MNNVTKLLPFLLFQFIFFVSHAQDWPNFKRYKAENEKLKEQAGPKDRVVFMGNSITDNWIKKSPAFFNDNHFIDRGIGGQTSPQMLLRFRADVIDLKPRAVVIECGTNDIAGNTGPSTLQMVQDNIMSMCELAKAHKIKVILGAVPPSNKFGWAPQAHPADSIIALNKWIKEYARKKHFKYVDYHSAMVDENKGMKKEYSEDGVHPNEQGYAVMEKLLFPVIRKVR
jgi:lysophospholipase L1-like esterase